MLNYLNHVALVIYSHRLQDPFLFIHGKHTPCRLSSLTVYRKKRCRSYFKYKNVTIILRTVYLSIILKFSILDDCFLDYNGGFTPEQDNDKTNVEPVHSYDAFHTRFVGPGVKGIIRMHRFNICLVVILSAE